MSYQIKSTPFFRRMVSTSKKNGQLQKLKEEYERIKDFNDRSIELRMRQVRLKRLFKEIEELKDTTLKRRRLSQEKVKTTEDKRVEAFVKSKALGKEYSKLNALQGVAQSGSKMSTISIMGNKSLSKMDIEKKARIAKRISYGNEISRHNMEKIATTPRKRSPKHDLRSVSSCEVDKKEQLKQRLIYGNSRSNFNMTKTPKRYIKHKMATDPDAVSTCSDTSRAAREAQLANCIQYVPLDFPTYCAVDEHANNQIVLRAMQSSPPRLDQIQVAKCTLKRRARKLWHKLALLVLYRLDHALRQNKRNELRSICNDTHLPCSKLSKVEKQISDEHILVDEQFVSVETLCDSSREKPKETFIDAQSQIEGSSIVESQSDAISTDLKSKAKPTKVQEFLKFFEPMKKDVPEKESESIGPHVHQMRSIFEYDG